MLWGLVSSGNDLGIELHICDLGRGLHRLQAADCFQGSGSGLWNGHQETFPGFVSPWPIVQQIDKGRKSQARWEIWSSYFIAGSWIFLFLLWFTKFCWMKHKLKSRLLGEISITSDMQMTPPLWQSKEELKNLLMKWKRRVKKLA